MSDSDIIKDALEVFRRCEEVEADNRRAWEEDVRFGRNDEQWPELIAQSRAEKGRPMHTVNRLAPVIRQVVNDSRANRPAISVRPVDNGADDETAEVLGGLIRNIESTSNADIAYDTAVEHAVAGGFGYFRVNIDYAHNDTFDKDIVIERVPNPLSIYADPDSFSPDGSDWNTVFVTDYIPHAEFKKRFKGSDARDFEGGDIPEMYRDANGVRVAEWWKREQVFKPIVLLSDGQIIERKKFDAQAEYFMQAMGLEVVGEREVASYKVQQYLLSGDEVLSEGDWPGCYIPIIPVIGDEVIIKDKRYLRSLIRPAKAANERYNYWISAMTEMIALAPRVPYIGPAGAFDVDENWSTANREDHPYLEYGGGVPPQRQAPPQPSAAMLQEAMSAAEDIKAITGIYDASLGARSNETSGRAISERKKAGDISTFHFTDNLSRSIRQCGRVLVDLIPKIYTNDRVVRVLGIDGAAKAVKLGAEDESGKIYDLAAGKYDVAVKSGPGYATQREETRTELVEIMRALPESVKVLGPMYLRACDWPGADDAADRLEGKQPGEEDVPPAVRMQMQQMQQVIQQGGAKLQELTSENEALKSERELKVMELQIKNKEADTKAAEAKARVISTMIEANRPQPMPVPQQSEPSPYGMAG